MVRRRIVRAPALTVTLTRAKPTVTLTTKTWRIRKFALARRAYGNGMMERSHFAFPRGAPWRGSSRERRHDSRMRAERVVTVDVGGWGGGGVGGEG